jgi:hypothetical protein
MADTKGKLEVCEHRKSEIWIGADAHIATCHGPRVIAEATAKNFCHCVNNFDDLERERDELRAALEKYGDHTIRCAASMARRYAEGNKKPRCICGFKKALDKAKK